MAKKKTKKETKPKKPKKDSPSEEFDEIVGALLKVPQPKKRKSKEDRG